jgi:hypothetical protein
LGRKASGKEIAIVGVKRSVCCCLQGLLILITLQDLMVLIPSYHGATEA